MTEDRSGESLRILAIHRYFWPDTPPYASLLRAIVERWAADGHRVEVLATQPSYKQNVENARMPSVEVINDVTIRRISLFREAGRGAVIRVLNMAFFVLAILFHAVIRRRYDVLMVSTAPPVFPGAAVRIASRLTGARFIYHCMDIHPEIGRISGEFRGRWLFNTLLRIDRRTCSDAGRVVVLSDDMSEALCSREGAGKPAITVINNFNMPDYEQDQAGRAESLFPKRDGVFRVLFAGNLGRFQGLEEVISAFEILAEKNVAAELVLMGDGKAVVELKKLAGPLLGDKVVFLNHQPVPVARQAMRDADLCLVSLVPDIYRYAYPSKTMTYLAEGCPLLVVVEDDSTLATLVRREGIGYTVPQSRGAEGIARVVAEAMQNTECLKAMREKARIVGRAIFDQEAVLDRWSSLARDLRG